MRIGQCEYDTDVDYLIEFGVWFEIVLGLFIGMLLVIIYRIQRLKYHGPNSNWIRNTILEYKGKYYRYTPSIRLCMD